MGRRILVTGASRGIGRGLAEHFLSQGDTVIGCARGDSDLAHEQYRHCVADVTDEEAVSRMFADIRTSVGGLDALINNAGTASMNPIALTTRATARQVVDVNVIGPFLLTRGAMRLLRASPAGRIVNLTSIAVPLRLDGEAVYAASKSALETFTRITAREVGRFGITCNAIGPSVIRTRLTQAVPKRALDALLERQAIAISACIGDVANVIDFFLKPESRLITGQVVYLGGFS